MSDDGGAAVTTRGVCWSIHPNPTTANHHTTDGAGAGTFTSAMAELTPGTLYHVRAYAANSVGTTYGADEEFTTSDTVYVDPDKTCGNNFPCYYDIQGAIDEAGDGVPIKVAEGAYLENVVINKAVIIEIGWDKNFTTVDQPNPVILRESGLGINANKIH